jgi:hypothetical protein
MMVDGAAQPSTILLLLSPPGSSTQGALAYTRAAKSQYILMVEQREIIVIRV